MLIVQAGLVEGDHLPLPGRKGSTRRIFKYREQSIFVEQSGKRPWLTLRTGCTAESNDST